MRQWLLYGAFAYVVTTRIVYVLTVQVVMSSLTIVLHQRRNLCLNHRWKGKECCADGSRNKENYARFHF